MANNAYNNNAAAGHFDPFSAIDFKRFCFLSILTIYIHTVTLKIDPFPIRRIDLKEGQNSMTLHTMTGILIGNRLFYFQHKTLLNHRVSSLVLG